MVRDRLAPFHFRLGLDLASTSRLPVPSPLALEPRAIMTNENAATTTSIRPAPRPAHQVFRFNVPDSALLNVKLELWASVGDRRIRNQNLTNRIREADCDRLRIAVLASVVVKLCKGEHVAGNLLNLSFTVLYVYLQRNRRLPAGVCSQAGGKT